MKSVSKVSRLEGGAVSASALEVRTLMDRNGLREGLMQGWVTSSVTRPGGSVWS
ncbi:hypothetical protein [Streptomyces sp. NBC_00385]|uniref:hypothetical protein n=1 Tax=Streptomyces sp. NBC_00385 TaxID=2975733 RepID=UPI002DDC0D83|nr:hypothetical protein [Streptomyces sp. NBC_00385]